MRVRVGGNVRIPCRWHVKTIDPTVPLISPPTFPPRQSNSIHQVAYGKSEPGVKGVGIPIRVVSNQPFTPEVLTYLLTFEPSNTNICLCTFPLDR